MSKNIFVRFATRTLQRASDEGRVRVLQSYPPAAIEKLVYEQVATVEQLYRNYYMTLTSMEFEVLLIRELTPTLEHHECIQRYINLHSNGIYKRTRSHAFHRQAFPNKTKK